MMVAKRTPSLSSDTIIAILAHSTAGAWAGSGLGDGGRNVDERVYLVISLLLAQLIFGDLCWRRGDFGDCCLASDVLLRQPKPGNRRGRACRNTEWLFLMLIALVVSIAVKLVGVLLITALMIIPAAAARRCYQP